MNQDCNVVNSEFIYASSTTANEGMIRNECNNNNEGNMCGRNCCYCRTTLIADLLDHLWLTATDPSNAEPYTDRYLHTKWNREENCPTNPGNVDMIPGGLSSSCQSMREITGYTDQPELKCCGSYPRRKPIITSTRDCCSFEKSYSILSEQCCEETQQIIPLGDMC